MPEPEGPWITEQIECRSCGWEWTCVHPACELVQCPNCNDMTKTHFIDQCDWANDGAMETMGRMGDSINRLIAERDRYREALQKIKSQSQDCLRNTCQTIAHFALHPKP